jgi:hypothetical protein
MHSILQTQLWINPLIFLVLLAFPTVPNGPQFIKSYRNENTKPLTYMEKQPLEVVRDFLTAVQQGDREKVVASLHPEVQWHQPGNNRIAGLKRSREEVLAMAGWIHQYTEGSYQLKSFSKLSGNGQAVAVLIHFNAATPVALLKVDNIDVYTVTDGLITEVSVFSADIEHEDRFWGK